MLNNWIYNGKEIKELSDMPEWAFGFVYEITHEPTGKKYIGKKQLIYIRNKKIGKRETKRLKQERKEAGIDGWWNVPSTKEVRKESDWKEYIGSNDELQRLMSINGARSLRREILVYGVDKKHLTFLETKYQFERKVLEDDNYLNTNILGKFFPKDTVNEYE